MKITNIINYLLNYRVTSVYRKMFGSDKKEGEAIHTRESWFAGVNLKENVLVRVETDEGIYGVGEALAHRRRISGFVILGIELDGLAAPWIEPRRPRQLRRSALRSR